jgi:hypothetical protein
MATQVRPYKDKIVKRDYFAQGFRLGLVFGALSALIMLGRGRG